MARSLRWFIYSLGLSAWKYPRISELETVFIDGSKNEIEKDFIPYENYLQEKSLQEAEVFFNSIEEKLERGEKVQIDCIQIAHYSVTINPFTPHLQLFMRDV